MGYLPLRGLASLSPVPSFPVRGLALPSFSAKGAIWAIAMTYQGLAGYMIRANTSNHRLASLCHFCPSPYKNSQIGFWALSPSPICLKEASQKPFANLLYVKDNFPLSTPENMARTNLGLILIITFLDFNSHLLYCSVWRQM